MTQDGDVLTGPVEKALRRAAARDGMERLVVAAAVRDGDGRVLLLRRRDDDFLGGIEELPSGQVEAGESLAAALARETIEESGLVLGDRIRYVGSFDYRSGSGRKTRQLTFTASARGTVRRSAEHQDHRWVWPRDLPHADLTPDTLRMLTGQSRSSWTIRRRAASVREPDSDG